jgi:catechol 2,3-dioxygenase-like lactoylglutathione lyase family enzyme
VPLVVLVDVDTVSYAEIFSGVLRVAGRARVVGTPTLGNALHRSERSRAGEGGGAASGARALAARARAWYAVGRGGDTMATRKTKSSASRASGTKARPAKSAARRRPAARAAVAAASSKQPRLRPETLRLRELSVALTVDDLARSMRFYTEALGFTVKQRWEREGKLMGVMLLAGDCELGLAQDDWAKGRDRKKGIGFRIYAGTTQNLEALAARIRAQGVEAVGPKKESWGARTVSVTDPDGFQITIHSEA